MGLLEEIIRTYIYLPPQPTGTGWYPVLCKYCNDHGRKGPRGAFRFEDDSVAYHCFNCSVKTGHKLSYSNISDEFVQVLTAFGIPEDRINKLRLIALEQKGSSKKQERTEKKLNLFPETLQLPDHFYRLDEAEPTDKWAEVAKFYLEDRKIDYTQYPFYLSTGIPSNFDGPESQKMAFIKSAQKWKKRIIIPIFKDGHLIFYQGRDLTGRAVKKYESPSVSRDCVLYGFDQLFVNEDRPLYVVEGFFDAFHINGVAILGNELTDAQITWLNKSRRKKVYVPDKFGNGQKIAERALKLGWHIALPDIGNLKDINDAIVKYGQLYVHNTLKEKTMEGLLAKTSLTMYCAP